MKWTPAQLTKALITPESLPPVLFIYGDDGGLVYKLSRAASSAICPTDDPFMVDRISAGDLKTTPSLLQESFETLAFGPGQKLIFFDASNLDGSTQAATTQALKTLFTSLGPSSATVVVVAAAGLEGTTAIAKAATAHSYVGAVRCFLDAARDLGTVINEKLAQSKQKITPEARQFLIESLGKDRGVTESELEKLILYTNDQETITLNDCLAIIAAAPSITLFKLCDAIGLRNRTQADSILTLLMAEGVDANMALAMVIRHLRRLEECHLLCLQGHNPQQAMAKLNPPVFMEKEAFAHQLQRTSLSRIRQSIEKLYLIQKASRQGLQGPTLVILRGLLALSF